MFSSHSTHTPPEPLPPLPPPYLALSEAVVAIAVGQVEGVKVRHHPLLADMLLGHLLAVGDGGTPLDRDLAMWGHLYSYCHTVIHFSLYIYMGKLYCNLITLSSISLAKYIWVSCIAKLSHCHPLLLQYIWVSCIAILSLCHPFLSLYTWVSCIAILSHCHPLLLLYIWVSCTALVTMSSISLYIHESLVLLLLH